MLGVSTCFSKTVPDHTFDIWNGTQYNVWTGWIEGMKIHWYYLTTSLNRLVQIIFSVHPRYHWTGILHESSSQA